MDVFDIESKSEIQLAEEFLYKRIDEKEYIFRKVNPKEWKEEKLLACDPKIFERLLKQLHRVYRLNLMRELNELTDLDICIMLTGKKKLIDFKSF